MSEVSSSPAELPAAVAKSEPLPNIVRDDEYWIEDGNVVLLAGNSAFKVYKGMLSAQSSVFRDMLAFPETEARETIDNCPAVTVSDSPEDLRQFLRANPPPHVCSFYTDPDDDKLKPTAAALFAVVRLAHKYNVAELLHQTLACAQTYFTSSFADWNRSAQWDDVPFKTPQGFAIEAIAVARLTETPLMLPVAFYECYSLGGKVLDGWKREDGSVMRLSDEDLRRCVDGGQRLARRAALLFDAVFEPTPTPVPGCKCDNQGIRSARACAQQEIAFIMDFPLNSSIEHIKLWGGLRSACSACVDVIRERDLEQRRAIWQELPKIFDLHVDEWCGSKQE